MQLCSVNEALYTFNPTLTRGVAFYGLVMFGKNTSVFFRNEVGTAASKCYTSCSEAYDFGS